MFRLLFLTMFVLGIVSYSNAKIKEGKTFEQNTLLALNQETLIKFDKYGVTFKYPSDYLIEDKILEESHYFKVYLDKNDDTLLRSIQIEWRNNPLKYDPISGIKGMKESIRSVYGNKVKFLREYETVLNGEKVYWSEFSLDMDGVLCYFNSGITRIGNYVFIIQKISDTDSEYKEADKIFESIRLTKN